MKHFLLLIIGCLFCGVVNAQEQQLFDEYLREAGDRAEMFVGKMEPGYSSFVFEGHPYWQDEEFVVGEVGFKGLLYKNVLLRYDAYLKQLVVKTPVKQSNVYVPMHWVDTFTIGGRVYVKHEGEFMAVLCDGTQIDLLQRLQVSLKENMSHEKLQYDFKRKVKYFILRDNQMCEVDGRRSVVKLYPSLEKELKRFAKMNGLNFREDRQNSLVALVKYADELLAKSDK